MELLNTVLGSIPVTELSPLYYNKLLVALLIVSMLLVFAASGKVADRRTVG